MSGTPIRRIVCGLDSSPQSVAALEMARAVAAEDAEITCVAVVDRSEAVHAGVHARTVLHDLEKQASGALERAQELLPEARMALLAGSPSKEIAALAESSGADLICVGSHGTGRIASLALGSVASALAQRAPCSVLIARERVG